MLGVGRAAEIAKNLTCHEALEAADDLGLALPFYGAPLDVVEGGLVSAHADDDYSVEGGVGLSIAAAVEAMAGSLATGGRDRAGAAQLGQGGFGADALRVITDEDEHLGCGAHAHVVACSRSDASCWVSR